MNAIPPTRSTPSRSTILQLAALAAVPLVPLLVSLASRDYGYFIDEFYYIACAKHLAFGFVDHPPLAPAILAVTRSLLGDSLLAIRLPAFLAMSATVWITALFVRELGGGRFATTLAALTVGLCPVLLAMCSFFSMNAFEPLVWTVIVLLVVRIVRTGQSRLWLAVGALVGLAFQNKHTVIMYLVALAAGVVLTRTRRVLADRWLWIGALVAAVLAAPNVIWQVVNGWPSLEFYRNAQLLKNVPSHPMTSLMMQVMTTHPLFAPVWMAGLVYLLVHRETRDLRFLGLAFIVLLAIHVASQTSRADRAAAGYPVLFAAGGVVIERGLARLRERRSGLARTLAVAAPTVAVVGGLALTPAVLTVLPPAETARFTQAIGATAQAERGKSSPIPQLLADRTGWEAYVNDMARAYWSLPPEDRAKAIFFAPSYGQAGSLELLGPRLGLPDRVIGSQNTYWHWSVGRTNTDVLIAVDVPAETLQHFFAEVWEAGRTQCDYCMSWRNDNAIHIARRSRVPIENSWPRWRHYE